MASSSFSCSVLQGFNFQKDSQELVGHLDSLKIGDKEFAADMAVEDPTKITEKEGTVKVVGVLSHIYWEGGYADPVQFSCNISAPNQQDAVVLQHTNLSNTEVVFAFSIYCYDPVSKVFYKAFHTDTTPLNGLIEKSGGDLSMNINITASDEVMSPINYDFFMGIMPKEEMQSIHYAVSESGKFVKNWGITAEA
ncbi:MAG: hypothetical protein GY839_11300 [candidate division Zixibacteria bacterium]|nr:hypothetical protein [candidate division Zixibacteria bacterium]